MSSVKRQYVKAVAELLEESGDVSNVLKRLREVMVRRGHLRLLPRTLKALEAELARRQKTAAPRLTLARKEDSRLHGELAKKAVIEIDETVIGGYVLQEGYTRTDNSYKTKLLHWYRTSIT